MEVFVIVFIIIISIIIYFVRSESHQDSIASKVDSLGGRLISYEKRNFFTGIGPFMVVGKGRMVYKIEYEINGIKKEGWVRFGGITGPVWRM